MLTVCYVTMFSNSSISIIFDHFSCWWRLLCFNIVGLSTLSLAISCTRFIFVNLMVASGLCTVHGLLQDSLREFSKCLSSGEVPDIMLMEEQHTFGQHRFLALVCMTKALLVLCFFNYIWGASLSDSISREDDWTRVGSPGDSLTVVHVFVFIFVASACWCFCFGDGFPSWYRCCRLGVLQCLLLFLRLSASVHCRLPWSWSRLC